ncbi:DNA mismatch repair protein MutL [Ruminiclostridium sufflavum DSM 19573]|uniref:DNA mismatch repair protein MutL n=1 Tax=Ruminiclostridium sufflavum DSM 19573 TaxID=1121337 RepID=A0A318XKD5_9FIRM|nr:DNA mismatch repair endonuclease MutL [Ruminiclostridium sufflavum]PYG87544.1 DNA mismatch repair protein MutL [Ruminiclostridium sufflavum DSM 19573]
MGHIIVLDENTSNKIAAGEVVEKPASVIKELVENSIDAGASNISVDIRNGGISYIKVTDNGSGMEEDDVEIAFERHATSKIKRAEDLDSVITMGFRGEALASIAAVSSVELQTKTAGGTYGMYVHVVGGVFKEVRPAGCPVGTTFIIKDLFFNTPARYKFLKKDATEAGYISDTLSRIALGNPDISFRLTSGKTILVHTPGNNDLKSAIYSIYGKEVISQLMCVEYMDERFKISGYVGKPEAARSNRNYQSLYINKRYIKSRVISYAVEQAYSSMLMKNKFPFFVLNIDINPQLVDANVHPAKMDVRFADESYLSRAVYMAVSKALSSNSLFNPVSVPAKDRELFKFKTDPPQKDYIQEQLSRQTDVNVLNKTSDKSQSLKATDNFPQKENNQYSLNNPMEISDRTDEIRILAKALEPLARTDFKSGAVNREAERLKTDELSYDISKEDNVTSLCGIKDISGNQGLDNTVCKEVLLSEPGEESDSSLTEPDMLRADLRLADMKYIGQAFSTYIILQTGDELVLVDQHAAHERILYEQLKDKFDSQENTTQLLLEPVVIQIQAFEAEAIKSNTDLLNRIGFVFEDFGNNSIIIRGIPYLTEGYSTRDIFLELADKIESSVNPINTPVADDIIHTIACKAAIKANKKLDDKEVRQLLTELENTGRRYTCPHGRPTVVRLTKYEIEKMFKRII